LKYYQVEPSIDQDDINSVTEYLNSGSWITEHNKTRELEDKIKSLVGRKYASAVPNGTIALYLSLLGFGLENKKIAVPNITMIATINSILWANSTPVLIDTDENLCMSFEELIKFDDLDAVLFVPLNGRAGDGEKIQKWCAKNDVIFIEDSAHSLGSSYENSSCGGLGDASVISFTPHKIITMGQGGMVLSNNSKAHEYITKLKTFNRSTDKVDWHEGFGLNFKITDLQAALGLSQFSKLDRFIENKKQNYHHYKNYIENDNVEVMSFNEKEIPWFFDMKVKSLDLKNEIIHRLKSEGIETRSLYPALSKQKYLRKYSSSNLNNSENIFDKILWLPSSNDLKENDIKLISTAINSIKIP
tara:strand:- start:33654 stop:34730 length:1077 start_codon:yes stop_codon:yes gene_type:complete